MARFAAKTIDVAVRRTMSNAHEKGTGFGMSEAPNLEPRGLKEHTKHRMQITALKPSVLNAAPRLSALPLSNGIFQAEVGHLHIHPRDHLLS